MATKIGPKTVTQRDRSKALVFCIDAANSRSFGGEPTTNSVQNPEFSAGSTTSWVKDGSVVWSTIADSNNPANSPYIIKITDGGYVWQYLGTANSGSDTVSAGQTYSFSCYMKGDGTVKIASWDNNSGTKTLASYVTLTNEWQFVQMSQSYNGSHLTTDMRFYPCSDLGGGGGTSSPVLYVCGPQVEQSDSGGGSYATPFVNGARTKANALENISGVGALGTTLTGTFASYGNKLYKPTARRVLATQDVNQGHIGGAYWDLDGTDEYIVTPVGFQVNNVRRKTIAMWVDVDGGTTLTGGTTNANTYKWQWMMTATHQPMQGSGYGTRYNFDAALITGQGWKFVVDVVDEDLTATNRVKRYIDGDLTASTGQGTDTGDNFYDGTDMYLYIGAFHIGAGARDFLNGRVANCMIWGDALTAKEVKDIYIAQKGRFGK